MVAEAAGPLGQHGIGPSAKGSRCRCGLASAGSDACRNGLVNPRCSALFERLVSLSSPARAAKCCGVSAARVPASRHRVGTSSAAAAASMRRLSVKIRRCGGAARARTEAPAGLSAQSRAALLASGGAARRQPVLLGARRCPLAAVLDSSSFSRQAGQIGCPGRSWRLGRLGCRPVCPRRGRWSGIESDSVAQVAVQERQRRQEPLEAITRKLRTLNGRVLDLSPEMRDLQRELERLR